MRILHLPNNISSQISVTVRALRDVGMNARGIVFSNAAIQNTSGVENFQPAPHRSPLLRKFETLKWWAKVQAAIRWAEVVHWHFHWSAFGGWDVRLAQLLRKKRVVEFWGSDIRIPEIEAANNPYYARILGQHEYVRIESLEASRRRQMRFARAGATVIVADASLASYLQRDLFPQHQRVRQRIYLSDYIPAFPDPANPRPLLIHSPSAPIIKGTAAVKATLETLSSSHTFEFQLVQNMPHTQAKAVLQTCDVFVDQFVLGSYGLAALEAMAYGKPVVAYIKPAMINQYPPDLPIVNATQETLPDVLSELIKNGQLRRELGERGRAYVEKYHDAHKLAQQLVEIYQSL